MAESCLTLSNVIMSYLYGERDFTGDVGGVQEMALVVEKQGMAFLQII